MRFALRALLAMLLLVLSVALADDTGADTGGNSAPAGVYGRVVNGTAGSAPPAGVEVTLFVFDADFLPEQLTSVSASDGGYAFPDVQPRPDYAYAVGVEHQGRLFTSEFVRGGDGDRLELPLTVYDLTDDPAGLSIISLETRLSPTGDGVEVVQIVRFANQSDRAYTTDREVADRLFASVEWPLPVGALPLAATPNDARYIRSAATNRVIDTVPVLPGDAHTIQVAYLLPQRDPFVIEQPIPYRLDGLAQATLHPASLLLVSDQLRPVDAVAAGSGATARYRGFLSLAAGDVLRYSLRPIAGGADTVTVPLWQMLLALAAGLVGTLIVGGGVLYLRRAR